MTDLEQAAGAACMAELEGCGLRPAAAGELERPVAPGITGWIGLALNSGPSPAAGQMVRVTPHIGARHEETSHIVWLLRRLAPEQRRSMGLMSRSLATLLPDQDDPPPGWATADVRDVPDLARRVADDTVHYGLTYLDSMSSLDAILKQFTVSPQRLIRRYDIAVMYMLNGQSAEARKTLMEKVYPVAQNPVTWGRGYENYAAFLDAFSAYFDIDLGIEHWPVRAPAEPKVTVNIADSGAVPSALLSVGRVDLAARAANLTTDQVKQIAGRGSALLASRQEKDPVRAIGLAAAELLDSMR